MFLWARVPVFPVEPGGDDDEGDDDDEGCDGDEGEAEGGDADDEEMEEVPPFVLTAETVGELGRDQLRAECKARGIAVGKGGKAALEEKLAAALTSEAGAEDGGQQDAGMEE